MERAKRVFFYTPVLLMVVAFYFLSLKNPFLFKSISEILGMLMTLSFFIFVWNGKHHFNNNYLLIVGVSFFFVGAIDFLHLLSQIEAFNKNKNFSAQFWLLSRYMEVFTLLLAYAFLKRRRLKEPYFIYFAYLILSILAVFSIFTWNFLPGCFQENKFFAKLICATPNVVIYSGIIWLHIKNKKYFELLIYDGFMSFFLLSLFSEIFFSLSSFGWGLQVLGHYAKLGSYFYIYRAVLNSKLGKGHFHQFKKIDDQNSDLQKKNNYLNQYKRDMNAEMALAKEVQEEMLPSSFPKIPGLRFSSIYEPIQHIGGDFFDFVHLEPNHTGIFISDVSGHGIAAAMMTMMLKALIQTSGELCRYPRLTLEFINKKLFEFSREIFITAIYAVYNHQSHELTYSRAAHPGLILIRGKSVEYIKDEGGFIIGMFNEGTFFSENSFKLEPGDKVILYTDGLIEALGESTQIYSNKLLSVLKHSSKKNIDELLDDLYKKLKEETRSKNIEDDICILGFERTNA